MKKERALEAERRQTEQSREIFTRSQVEAMKLIPDLADETSQAAQIYRQVLDENPDLISNPRGPAYVARLTKERLASNDSPNGDQSKEVDRLKRISAGQAAFGKVTSNDNRIVLTQAEKDLCDHGGISYESYARNKKLGATAFKEGVSVDE